MNDIPTWWLAPAIIILGVVVLLLEWRMRK